MTKEQEAINNIKVFIRSIKSDLAEESEDNQKLANDIETVLSMLKEKDKKIEKVLELIFQYGQIDGAHHKLWVIDQIVRILTGDKYKEWVEKYTYDEETGEYYTWDKGIAP